MSRLAGILTKSISWFDKVESLRLNFANTLSNWLSPNFCTSTFQTAYKNLNSKSCSESNSLILTTSRTLHLMKSGLSFVSKNAFSINCLYTSKQNLLEVTANDKESNWSINTTTLSYFFNSSLFSFSSAYLKSAALVNLFRDSVKTLLRSLFYQEGSN